MKQTLLGYLLFLTVCLVAGEWENIPYYRKNIPFHGDKKAAEKYCKLDIKTPGTKNFPTLVWLHGGGLKWGDKFFPQEIDTNKYIGLLACTCTVFPNLNDAQLQNSYGVMCADELLKAMLLPGEYADYLMKVQEICGFDKSTQELVDEAKN